MEVKIKTVKNVAFTVTAQPSDSVRARPRPSPAPARAAAPRGRAPQAGPLRWPCCRSARAEP